MRNLLTHWTKTALCLGIAVAATGMASAQATVTAQRGAEIAPFVQTTLLRPDWGPQHDFGYTIGVDYTRFIRSILQPSLELRMTSASGTTVNEHSYLGGLKLATTIHGIQPYATLMAGTGSIRFNYPVQGSNTDTSFVYAIGAGAEFRFLNSWKVRADFAQQHWNLDPDVLTPITMSVGIAYSIPFHGSGGVR
jgi:opacity protein-like surface antigen